MVRCVSSFAGAVAGEDVAWDLETDSFFVVFWDAARCLCLCVVLPLSGGIAFALLLRCLPRSPLRLLRCVCCVRGFAMLSVSGCILYPRLWLGWTVCARDPHGGVGSSMMVCSFQNGSGDCHPVQQFFTCRRSGKAKFENLETKKIMQHFDQKKGLGFVRCFHYLLAAFYRWVTLL